MIEHVSPPPHNSRPYVTVVIPVYNTEKYLRETLDSVLMQSLNNIEILCINDGSTDSSQQILEEYANKDNRIKIIVNEENKGIGQVRNLGIDNTSAKYMAILSSDDYYSSKNTLEKYYSVISESDDIFSIKTKKTIVKTVGGELEERDVMYPPRIFNNDLIKKHNIRYVEGYTYEDWTFELETLLCKISNNYKNIVLDGSWWVYRRREDRTSITETRGNAIDRMAGYRALEKKIKATQDHEQVKLLRLISCFFFRDMHSHIPHIIEWRNLVQDWHFNELSAKLEKHPYFSETQKYYWGYYLQVARDLKFGRIVSVIQKIERIRPLVPVMQKELNV